MALTPLATTADLDNRGIVVPDNMDAATLLASATDAVRDAAGCPISSAVSTIDLPVWDDDDVVLPGWPVTAVASVAVNGIPVAASVLTNGCWSAGWRRVGNTIVFTSYCLSPLPVTITSTYTHGLPIVPADIVDLVCSIVAMAANEAGEYGQQSRRMSIRLGDYSETFVHPQGTESPSPVAVPAAVRQSLRARFGTSVAMVRI